MLLACIFFVPLLLLILFSRAQVLVDFQVAQPLPLPTDAQQCTVQILKRDFAFSFGMAEIVQFTPPTDCGTPGSWAGVSLNFTVTSVGRQFDRLAIFTFQNVEIWRSSTPEPTRGDGIIWTALKDVTRYMPLFAKPGTFILQLDNLITDELDGVYSTTLDATFYASSAEHPSAPKSDLIIPLSTLSNTTGNDASVPPGFSINVTLPQNTIGAYAELYASGNGQEEFWYFNAANEFVSSLPPGTTLGQGPFREVRLLIDGQLAGTAFPYATIFTGGIVPTAWRPITAYGALDLPTYFLDVTPFVPILTDGQSHNFTVDVVSAEEDHTILQNWFVSGLLQVITARSSERTTGAITVYSAQPFAETVTTGVVEDNGDLSITVTASRQLRIESDIISGSDTTHVVWSQDLIYSNLQTYTNGAMFQNVSQAASGKISSTHDEATAISDIFAYPLNINYTNLTPDATNFRALFDHSYNRDLVPSPFILATKIRERQLAGGFFQTASTGNTGNGTSNNTFSYSDAMGNTYHREVNAVLNNITFNSEEGSLATLAPGNKLHFSGFPEKYGVFGGARLPNGRVVF